MRDKKEVRDLCQRQAECIIAILGSVYSKQRNHAHPGGETVNRIAGLIGDVVTATSELYQFDKIMTDAEWASLSAESRHRINIALIRSQEREHAAFRERHESQSATGQSLRDITTGEGADSPVEK